MELGEANKVLINLYRLQTFIYVHLYLFWICIYIHIKETMDVLTYSHCLLNSAFYEVIDAKHLWASIKTSVSLDCFYSCTIKIQDGLRYWPNEMRAWRNHLNIQRASEIPMNYALNKFLLVLRNRLTPKTSFASKAQDLPPSVSMLYEISRYLWVYNGSQVEPAVAPLSYGCLTKIWWNAGKCYHGVMLLLVRSWNEPSGLTCCNFTTEAGCPP